MMVLVGRFFLYILDIVRIVGICMGVYVCADVYVYVYVFIDLL